MKTMLLIVNPCSGQKKAKKHLCDLVDVFNRAGFQVITHITACSGDGEQAAMAYASQVDRIVCCGGDGTFNETVSGVLKSGVRVPIGYVPCGSTNDFAASLQLSGDLLQAARDAAGNTTLSLDVGSFGSRYFTYVASFGAFTRASFTTPQSMKNILGHAAYVLSGIQELSQLRSQHLRFVLENGQVLEDDYIFGAISNSTSVGGVLTLDARQVDMTDGLFELLLIRNPKDLFELGECVRCLQQKDYSGPMLTFQKAAGLTVFPPEDMSWTLDGEQETGHPQVQVRCLHRAIDFIIPNP